MNVSGPLAAPHAAPKKDWTLLFYLNGDNNLREEVTRDLLKLHNEGSGEDVTAVASLYRGDWRWSLKNVPVKLAEMIRPEKHLPVPEGMEWSGRTTYLVHQGDDFETKALEQVEPGSARVSDPQELRDFLIEQMSAYPAERYALTIAGHGKGKGGLLVDGWGEAMSLSDFRQALTEAREATGQKLDVLILESCLMGQPEVVEQLKGSADFLVASPEKLIADRAPYQEWLRQLKSDPSVDGRQLAEQTQQMFAPTLKGMQVFPLTSS